MKPNKKVLILHGWGGSDFPHWQSWLACELAKEYGTVSFFKFSNPDAPKLDMWKRELIEHLSDFKPDILLCHSLANILWLHLCHDEKIQELQKLYLVAPPSLSCDIEELESFFPVLVPKRLYAKETLLITSTNDPYMCVEEAEDLQKKLGVKMKVLQDAGHVNAQSGYGKWEWILQEIQK